MRRIAEFENENLARRFADHLLTVGIDSRVRDGEGGAAQVWVVDDDQIDRALTEHEGYVADPSAEQYDEAERSARAMRAEEEKQRRKSRHREVRFRTRFERPPPLQTPISMGLLLICTALFVMTDFGNPVQRQNESTVIAPVFEALGYIHLFQDEWWRRLTTQLFHGGMIHFAFCMMVLYRQLPLIEGRLGSMATAALCILFAGGSALGDSIFNAIGDHLFRDGLGRPYVLVGMSGVLYGVIGLMWTLGRLAPRFGLGLETASAYIYLVWFILCFFAQNISNGGHTGGVIAGALVALGIARVVKQGAR